MSVPRAVTVALLGLAALAGGQSVAQSVDLEELINAQNAVFGRHKGFRSVHAKGFCGTGSFQATPEASALSKASVLDGRVVPSMFRFSLSSGAPDASDVAPNVRSLTARLETDDGEMMDLVMIHLPIVFARDPADFAPFFRALAPDPATGKPDPAKLEAHLEKHPEAARFLELLGKEPLPASYAAAPYFAVHTFYFTNAAGERRPARWIFEPVAGRAGLTEEQAKRLAPDYLQSELRERLAQGPVAWDAYLQLPEPEDPLLDASTAWPEDRQKVKVGRLELTAVDEPGSKGPCDEVMFDPTLLVEGIEPSDDPMLLIRPSAYAVSFSRRMEP